MHQVTLYTRDGCCLCAEARAVLVKVRDEVKAAFALEERDIEADEQLLRAYLERIPVVTIDGEEVFEFHVDESELRQRLGIVRSE